MFIIFEEKKLQLVSVRKVSWILLIKYKIRKKKSYKLNVIYQIHLKVLAFDKK